MINAMNEHLIIHTSQESYPSKNDKNKSKRTIMTFVLNFSKKWKIFYHVTFHRLCSVIVCS